MSQHPRRSFRPLLGAAAISLSASASWAAPPESPTAASSQITANADVEEIIVTARRREESLQSVPLAVTALSGENLREAGVATIYDLTSQSPALTVTAGAGNTSDAIFSMRAQSQSFGGSQAAVVPYFAEVPMLSQANVPFFDLQSVQVLKGPQGTLFGRNTTGGAILFTPAKPTATFGGTFDIQAGSYEMRQLQGALNVPLAENRLSVRFAGDIQRREGYTRNVFTNEDLNNRHNQSYRAYLRFTPSDSLTNDLILDGYKSRENSSGAAIDSVSTNGLAYAVVGQSLIEALNRQRSRSVHEVEQAPNLFSNKDLFGAVNTTQFDISDALYFKNIVGYRTYKGIYSWDQDGTGISIVDAIREERVKQFSNELQAGGVTFGGNLTWISGLYYEQMRPTGANVTRAKIFGSPFQLSNQRIEDSKAVFAQGTYDFGDLVDGLKLTVGGRYTWDTRRFDALDGTPINEAKFEAGTYNISLDYQYNSDTLLYLAARKGYKSGGFNNSSSVAAGLSRTFEPEFLQDYELGVKTSWQSGPVTVRLDAAAFYGQYSEVQRTVTALINGQLLTPTINVASANILGAELQYDVSFGRLLNLAGFYSYIDPSYERFRLPNGADQSANRFPYTPTHKLGISATATPVFSAVTPNMNPVLRIGYYYQSDSVSEIFNDGIPNVEIPSYSTVDLRISWRELLGSGTEIALFGNNLLDEEYRVFATGYETFKFNAFGYGPPRMWGAEFRKEF